MKVLTEYLKGIAEDKNINTNGVILEKSKDNKDIFKVKHNNKIRYIGSKYNVQQDIDNFCEDFKDINIDTIIIIFGLSTGEHINKIQKIIKKFNRVLVIEPDKRVLKSFLTLEKSKAILEDERISIIGFEEKNLQDYIAGFIWHESNYNNIKVCFYSNYDKLYLSEYTSFLRILKDTLRAIETNVATEIVLGKKFMESYLNNIKHISNSYTINHVKDKFKGFTAIIVSAGPSLEKNIHKLKQVKDNAIIICGNRTLKPLMEKGITPHFMCAVDCSDLLYEMTSDYLYKRVPLVFTETTNSKLVEAQEGPKVFFKYGVVDTNIGNIFGKSIDSLYSGGSVAHSCVDFAKYLGCISIIFVGQDLAYTENKHHANIAGTNGDKELNYNVDLIKVKSLEGDTVYTTRVLDGFRKNFEDYIEQEKQIKFINATEGGAHIEGTEILTLEESINKYAVKSGIDKIISEIFQYKNTINENKNIIKKNLIHNYDSIVDMKKNLEKLRKAIKDSLDSDSIKKIRKTQKLIADVNRKIDNDSYMKFLNFLTLPVISKSPVYFRYEESEVEIENVKNILEGFYRLYGDFIKCIEDVKVKIEDCIEAQ
ncbi:motility associated factor glycosyltransferase family protein [Desnuesiella massiliensis]|uniref:motility associated factor glycosyltransferase family protein n=1 Tax=Desnuesiella massiliensis TaxID=1650662 RepID=UPI0006E434A6|nr:6-hydroxymethylpterin diphosphokinase MptE-like protein [Desnuesiella massiliensis]